MKYFAQLFILIFILLFASSFETTIERNIQFQFNENKKYTGVVDFYNENKHFGYIKSNGEDIYVYEIGLIDEIKQFQDVVFYVRDTRKGLEAYDVRILKK